MNLLIMMKEHYDYECYNVDLRICYEVKHNVNGINKSRIENSVFGRFLRLFSKLKRRI